MFTYSKRFLLSDLKFKACLVIFSALLYANTLGGGYVWDDRAAIISNRDVLGTNPLSSLFQNDFWGQNIKGDYSHKSYRPVTVLSFRLNHIIHGLNAKGYHAVNILIYMATSVLVYEIFKRWASSKFVARCASALWCAHPVHVEAVASLVGRADSLCGVFFAAAILAHTQCMRCWHDESKIFNGKIIFVLGMICSISASLSKEIGVTIFGVLILLEVAEQIVLLKSQKEKDKDKQQTSERNKKFAFGFKICLTGVERTIFANSNNNNNNTPKFMISPSAIRILVFVFMLAIQFPLRSHLNGDKTVPIWTMLENHIHHMPVLQSRILSYAQSHFWYCFKLVFPRYLCFDYGYACIPTIYRVFDVRNLLPLLFCYLPLALVIHRSISHVRVPLLIGITFFLVPLFPALNILFPVGTILAERLLFIPSIGFCLLFSELAVVDLKLSTRPIIAFVTGVCLLFSVRVLTRNLDWNSEQAIYSSALQVCPLSAKALTNYAVLSMNPLNMHNAIASAITAVDVYKNQAPAYINAGVAHQRLGYLAKAAWYYQMAMHVAGRERDGAGIDNGKMFGYLGGVMYEWSLRLGSAQDLEQIKNNYGDCKSNLRYLQQQAGSFMDTALQYGFSSPTILHSRGSLAMDMKDFSYAVKYFTFALNKQEAMFVIEKDVPKADQVEIALTFNQLGNAYQSLGDILNAVKAFEKGLSYDNNTIPVLANLGSVYRTQGRLILAQQTLKRGLEVYANTNESPSAAVVNNLALVEQDMGNYQEAIRLFNFAIELVQGQEQEKSHSTVSSSKSHMRSSDGNESVMSLLAINLEKAKSIMQKQNDDDESVGHLHSDNRNKIPRLVL